ncbi:uncharacterized protein BX663DRAFT_431187 [Cokeromyces recurvatus]|uniref:uncharacterized protein n=1 Tax=Cokeromyces recurvatus TaxID=90255 RepID=UPI00221E4A6D|nr:uncharacterized protein BX663DRAFT_431187 [Cokeromyces recurvatus]KAI7904662.1 hypothetical protein BX663DRAFT_431187 [Cokeromyces recurvatus]
MHLRSITTQELLFSRRNSGNAANKINNNKPGKHKLEMISTILQDFPYRKFILVGDSGEMDPEIYQQIYNEHPDQIIKIFIHDVSSHRAIVADRDNYNNNPQHQQSDSYYNSLQRFISRESTLLRRGATPQLAMDALAETEIPPNSNSQIIASTKLEQFEERMKQISNHMREGVFTVFTLASQLLLDPVITEEFLLLKASQDLFL